MCLPHLAHIKGMTSNSRKRIKLETRVQNPSTYTPLPTHLLSDDHKSWHSCSHCLLNKSMDTSFSTVSPRSVSL